MRKISLFWALPLALVLAGCGEGRFIVNVDVLSFMDPADRDQAYGPIPAGLSGTVESTPFEFNTPEGVGGQTLIDSVIVTAAADLDNQTGSADVEFQIFFDTVATNLYSGTPAITVSATLAPGTVTPVAFSEPVPEAFLGLFNAASVVAGVRIVFQSNDPPLGPDLQGVAHITQLLARIVASEDVF